jgi:hypothetical protein
VFLFQLISIPAPFCCSGSFIVQIILSAYSF